MMEMVLCEDVLFIRTWRFINKCSSGVYVVGRNIVPRTWTRSRRKGSCLQQSTRNNRVWAGCCRWWEAPLGTPHVAYPRQNKATRDPRQQSSTLDCTNRPWQSWFWLFSIHPKWSCALAMSSTPWQRKSTQNSCVQTCSWNEKRESQRMGFVL